jgi:hypothetical protein
MLVIRYAVTNTMSVIFMGVLTARVIAANRE